MINHPNRSTRRRVRIVLRNGEGHHLDERIVSAHRNDDDEWLASETSKAAASLILENNLRPGDTVTVTEIER